MTKDNGLHEPEPIEQPWVDASPAQDGPAKSSLGEVENDTGSDGAPAGLLALMDDEWPAAVWAIEDLAERARALHIRLPLTCCENAEWVKLIRSVNHPAAGPLGAQLQDRIGSERAWEEGRQRWKRKMKELRKSLAEEVKDFKSFENLYLRLLSEGRLLLTKEEYHEKAIEDWIWDFDNLSYPVPTSEMLNRSNKIVRESGEKWLLEIKAWEHDLHLMELDYEADGRGFESYRNLNLALAHRGDSKITRAEFWAERGRNFDPTRLSLYRALLGDLAMPAGSSGGAQAQSPQGLCAPQGGEDV